MIFIKNVAFYLLSLLAHIILLSRLFGYFYMLKWVVVYLHNTFILRIDLHYWFILIYLVL